MNRFLTNLKHQAEQNPLVAITVGIALVTVTSKFINSAGSAMGSAAYAKQVNYRISKNK